jgi:predicted RNA-binding Zn-ribbon protein involved in translation (DUF1610 family)
MSFDSSYGSTLHTFQELIDGSDKAEFGFAYCTSIECCGVSRKRVLMDGVTGKQRRCPECGKQLTWRTRRYPRDLMM